MTVINVGLSHKQAPIALREQLAAAPGELPARLAALRKIPSVREALILSTCSRLELFVNADDPGVAADLLDTLGPQGAALAVCRKSEDALRHLFRVASSLDSMVVGEAQILGQLKEAAAAAREAGTLGRELGTAVAQAVNAARRVRTETAIARGAVSLSSVAVDLAKKLLGPLTERSVLLLGAGEMAQLAARELGAHGARELLVANRSADHARELAAQVGGVPVSLDELPRLLERADVVICSTGAQRPVITRELVERALLARRHRPLFLVDLSLPRNIAPSANQLEGVYVYDLDDLERVAAQNRGLREAELGKAEAIVEEELAESLKQARERTAVPVLGRLRARAEQVAKAEVEKTLGALRGLDERQAKCLRAMASAIVNKLLHEPTMKLRAEAGEGPLADAALQLFGLDEAPQALQQQPPQPLARIYPIAAAAR